jgi:predicted ferric reductase
MEKPGMRQSENYLWKGILWTALYTFLILTPLIILILGPKTPGREPLQNLAVGLGFTGLAIMALQHSLTARIKLLNEPFGSDMIYYFHRQIAFAAFVMLIAHPILLFFYYSGFLSYLLFFNAPLFAKMGVLAIVFLLIVVGTAEYRSQLKLPYAFWKFWHGIFVIPLVGLAILHIYINGNFLNLPWKNVIWIIYFIIWMGLLTWTRIIYPLRLYRHPFEVKKVKEERANCTTLQLAPKDGQLFSFHPGQFAWLTAWKTPFSDSEHPFSLVSSAEDHQSIQFTIKALGKFTTTIKEIKPGDRVFVDGPYGSFSCDRYLEAKALILIAGGIGVTPIMSTLRTLADRKDPRPLLLLYANRDWENVTFREELENLQKRLTLKIVHVLEKPPVDWQGETGYMTTGILQKYIDEKMRLLDPQIFVCGPKPMMNAVEKQLAEIGFQFPKVHSERFAL